MDLGPSPLASNDSARSAITSWARPRRGAAAVRRTVVAILCALAAGLLTVGCSKGSSSSSADAADGSSDGLADGVLPLCVEDGGAAEAPVLSEAGVASDIDEFAPNAPVAKMASSIGRVNIYAATAPRSLDRVDVYLGSALAGTRVTIAVQEAAAQGAAFQKVFDVQLDFGACRGWASTGPISVPLVAGHFYAVGLDPNQPIDAYVSTDANALPIDGAFGRLVSSKTTTSVSNGGLTWDKASTAEFNRQRLATSPRVPDARDVVVDAAAPVDAGDAAPADAPRG
ncbi:MAG TPA: hypothetical protein VIU64_16775 [Polyangia bacterium]